MKKVPLRKCVATQEQLPKKELMNGRGAYLKRSLEAIEIAEKKGVLKRALNVDIPDSIFEELKTYVK